MSGVATGSGDRRDVALLLRRAGFGAPAAEVDALAALGYEGAVEALCAPLTSATPDAAADAVDPPVFDTAGYLAARDGTTAERQAAAAQARAERRALALWSIRRMAAADHPLREKLAFLWHGHFATSTDKVKLAELMFQQHRTLGSLGPGRFDELVHAVARDPAMLIWLDGRESTAAAPNENFARELFELFTLGHGGAAGGDEHGDAHGDGARHDGGQPYTEADVAAAARALTGWTIAPDGSGGVLRPGRFDSGPKTLLGTTGPLGLDDVVRLATTHPACAPHVVSRLWSRLARPAGPADPVVVELAAAFARDLDTATLVRSIFLHPEFRTDETRAALVKTPVELVVGTHRALGAAPTPAALLVLDGLGQTPFAPPDVSGWTENEGWLSTASALVRLQFASTIDPGAALDPVRSVAADDRPSEVGRLLGVDAWGPVTAAALRSAADDPRALLTLAITAPEHVLN